MIRIENVSKSFGSKEIIRDISFIVKPGEILTLTGPSGCGKSTVLNIVSGLLSPDTGSVIRSSERIGYAFQKDILIPWKSALENVLYILKGHYHPGEAYEIAASILQRMGLADDMHKKPSAMSGGMKKRVNIARAIVLKPDILLLDEPFVFLDDKNIEEITAMIKKSAADDKSAVILVTHDRKYTDTFHGNCIEIVSATGRARLKK